MPENKKDKNSYTKYIQLTGIAFEMMAIMFVFIWLGKKGDQKWGGEESTLYTLFGTLIGLGISMYLVLKQLKSINEK